MLWPLVDRPILEYQLRRLAAQGVKRTVVFSSGDRALSDYGVEIVVPAGMEVEFLVDRMPRGAAGCVRDAVARFGGGPVIAFEGRMVWLPDVGQLAASHERGQADLTVFTIGAFDETSEAEPAGAYVCGGRALRNVSSSGYQDIKEQMIPALLKDGGSVAAVPLPGAAIAGRNLAAYLSVVGEALATPEKFGVDLSGFEKKGADVWAADGSQIDESSRMVGPAVLLDGARVGPDAMVLGPAVSGRGASVGPGAVVDRSVLWDGATVGRQAYVREALVDEGARVRARERVAGNVVANARLREAAALAPAKPEKRARGADRREESPPAVKRESAVAPARAEEARRASAAKRGRWARGSGRDNAEAVRPHEGAYAASVVGGGIIALAALVWAYSTVLTDLWGIWTRNDDQSSGLLVPFLALYVAFNRRHALAEIPARAWYWGAAVVILGFAMRFGGTMLQFATMERFSIIVVVTGMVLTIFGPRMTRKVAWVLAFLLLMLPMPGPVQRALSLPLQGWATTSAVFVLELFGWIVVREGNVMSIGDTTVAVAEACNGLRMLMAFVIVSTLAAFVSKRAWWEKGILVASSIPIAIICNTIRLSVTAMAFTRHYGESVNMMFHDWGGYAMMPLALGMLGLEILILDRIAPEVAVEEGAARGGGPKAGAKE